MEEASKSSYGKRPLWQWIALYVVIGVIVYGLVYYFVLNKKGVYNTPTSITPSTSQTTPASTSGELLMTESGANGNYLADSKGMTLYTYDKDSTGVSNCYANCAVAWPPYLESGSASAAMPSGLTTVKRTDGNMQYAYNGKPLYYYANDSKPGDTTGDGVGGIWHLVKP